MGTTAKHCVAEGSATFGATVADAQSESSPIAAQSSAPPSTASSRMPDGDAQAISASATRYLRARCTKCGHPIYYSNTTGLCRVCYRNRWIASRCACGGNKLKPSRCCLACYRREMALRNHRERDLLTLARETGRAGDRRSKLELRAEELFAALSLKFTRNFPIGRFVADFYLPDFRIVVECYGPLHRKNAGCLARDPERAAVIAAAGLGFVILSDLDQHLWWRLLRDATLRSGTSPSPA